MRLALLLVAVLAAPLFSGCFADECPTCAQPTTTISPPIPTPPTKALPPNYNDAGFVMTQGWHVGDQWDYTSNLTNQRTVKIVGQANVSGKLRWQMLEVLTTRGKTTRATSWVLDGNFTRVNLTSDSGVTQTYSPYPPVRILRNASYSYNVTTIIPPEAPTTRAIAVKTQFTGQSVRALPWGNTIAGRIEETDKSGGSQSRIVHWPSRDYANDAFFVVNDEEFGLVAAHVGDRYYAQESLRSV